MKKIEAVILARNEENVVDALRKLDLGGMSLFPRMPLGARRGTGAGSPDRVRRQPPLGPHRTAGSSRDCDSFWFDGAR